MNVSVTEWEGFECLRVWLDKMKKKEKRFCTSGTTLEDFLPTAFAKDCQYRQEGSINTIMCYRSKGQDN